MTAPTPRQRAERLCDGCRRGWPIVDFAGDICHEMPEVLAPLSGHPTLTHLHCEAIDAEAEIRDAEDKARTEEREACRDDTCEGCRRGLPTMKGIDEADGWQHHDDYILPGTEDGTIPRMATADWMPCRARAIRERGE